MPYLVNSIYQIGMWNLHEKYQCEIQHLSLQEIKEDFANTVIVISYQMLLAE